ncbi:MAG: thioredoxin family protein [Opitutaceae bacterium]|nr:thioredoxin family protein [Opitutaceae bacterium]
MIPRRLLAFVLAAFLPLCALPASLGAKPVRNGAVQVELVSRDASLQPGRPFWVALRLDHDAHWHSYWINAGTGYPTSLTWTLPAGFKAGPIVWPTPHVVKDSAGKVTGNGYENRTFLFTEITPPADLPTGTRVTLKAFAEWLMCADVCMPGDAQLELTLPVDAGAPGEHAAVAGPLDQAFRALPQASPDWVATATRQGATVTLRFAPAPGRNPAKLSDLHYFDAAAVVDYAAPQALREENGAYVLELAVAAEAPADAPGLRGVLSAGGTGFLIDAPFARAVAAGPAPVAPVAPPPPPAAAAGSLAGTLALAFVGGLILNLMPCVFPVLGIKILGFVNQSGNDRRKITAHGLVFSLGVLISFWVLAGILLALRAGGAQLGWGFQLQSPAFVFGMAAFLLVFALNMSGLFEVGLAATAVGGSLQMKEGYAGSFFTGALAVLVATPCSAPFLAPALGAALTPSLPPAHSVLVFTSIGVGLALPYLLLSLFPGAVRFLPRPGAWMETFKQLMAFPLYATVGWLLWVLAGQTKDDDYALLLIAFGFVLVAMAAWAYGRFGQAPGKPGRQLAGRVFAALLLAGGLFTGWPKPAEAAPTNGAYQVTWEKWSPEAVAAGQAAGRFVYVDFTARWCATCQTNKAAVFSSADVLAEFGRRNVLLLKADWTNKDAAITAALARWNRSAVPFNLIYAPGRPEPVILPELLTPGKVLEALAQAGRSG